MTCTIDTKSKRHLSAKLAAGLAISAFLVLGTFVTSANAQDRRDDHRGGEHRDHRGHPGPSGDYRGYNGHDGPGGGYYAAPPVVYGTPYYYPPPVVYGPAIGITMPGVSIGIR